MVTAQPKQEQKTVLPTNPEAKAEDDRYSTPSNPGSIGVQANRKRDGERLANDVEHKGSAAPRSDTAQRDSEVNSFCADRSQDGSHKAGSV